MRRKIKPKRSIIPIFSLFIIGLGVAVTIILSQSKTNLMQYAAGNDYYVSPSGSDSSNGSQASPFLTIQKAANVVSAGSTVHVLPGTYTGAVINNASGTATAPITYVSDTKWGAKIVTSGGLRVF